MRPVINMSAVVVHTENAAEDPSPAPTGRVARTVKVNDGLSLQ